MKADTADEPAGFGAFSQCQNTSGNKGKFVGLDEDHLLRNYSPTLGDWAWRYCRGNGALWNDLLQESALGLFQAARRFDPAQGVKFSTLARRDMRGRMLNYSRSECRHRRCRATAQVCHQAGDHDAENPPQEDCLPIGAPEVLEQTERFLFGVDLNLLRGVMQQCLTLLTWQQQQVFTMRFVDERQPSDVARVRYITGNGDTHVDGIHGEDKRRICEVMIWAFGRTANLLLRAARAGRKEQSQPEAQIRAQEVESYESQEQHSKSNRSCLQQDGPSIGPRGAARVCRGA